MTIQLGFIQKYVCNNVVSIGSRAIYLLLEKKRYRKYIKNLQASEIYIYTHKKYSLDVMRK